MGIYDRSRLWENLKDERNKKMKLEIGGGENTDIRPAGPATKNTEDVSGLSEVDNTSNKWNMKKVNR